MRKIALGGVGECSTIVNIADESNCGRQCRVMSIVDSDRKLNTARTWSALYY
jgi:hypothetical protein